MTTLASLLAVVIAITNQASPQPSQRMEVPWRVGERAEYDVKFSALRVGTGSMEVMGIENVRGRDAWRTQFRIKGGNFLYKVDDLFESWSDVANFTSLRFHKDQNEGSRDVLKKFEIHPDKSMFIETTLPGERGKTEQPSVTDPLDDGSFLYFMRTVPLEVGQTYSFNRYFMPDRNPVTIKVLRRETIKVPAGEFPAIVVQPIIKTKGVFSEDGHAEVWFTDDRSRIMLQMKSKLSFGSINLYLKSYRPGTPTSGTK